MSDQNVVSTITSLLEAVLEYRRVLSATQHTDTPTDQANLKAFVRRAGSPLIDILFGLKLTILATNFRQSVEAVESADSEIDTNGWCSTIEKHNWFLNELVIELRSISAWPSLIQSYGGDAEEVDTACEKVTDMPDGEKRATSGLIIDENIGKVSYKGGAVSPGKTIPFQLLVIAHNKFGHVVPYAEISSPWGKFVPDPGARRRNVSSVNTQILKPLGAPLELRCKRNTGIILRPITSG